MSQSYHEIFDTQAYIQSHLNAARAADNSGQPPSVTQASAEESLRKLVINDYHFVSNCCV